MPKGPKTPRRRRPEREPPALGTEPSTDPDAPAKRGLLSSLAKRFPNAALRYHRTRSLIRQVAARWRLLPNTVRWFAQLGGRLWRRRREPRLRVAVDISAFWEPLTGIGWYLYRLLEHLADRDDLCLRLYGPWIVDSPDAPPPTVTIPSGRALERLQIDVPEDLFVPAGRIIGWLRQLEPMIIGFDRSQVVFAPNYFPPRRFAASGGARVSTIHDLGVFQVPWTLRQETLEALSAKLERTLAGAERLITVSAAVRDELVAGGHAGAERIDVVHHGPGQLAAIEPRTPVQPLPEAFALHVGTLEPRKNILHLLDSWELARSASASVPQLVLSGRFGWKTDEIQPAVEAAIEAGWLLHLGYVEADELAWLYRHASAVVFPSLYEGFGLPAIEALWAGTPLICSDIPVLREVAGEAALYGPAEDAAAFSRRIVELMTDDGLRASLVERGRARAAQFTWTRSAERTARVFFAAAGRPTDDGGTDA